MKEPQQQQSEGKPTEEDTLSTWGDLEHSVSVKETPQPASRLVGVFVTGFLSATLLCGLVYLFVLSPQRQTTAEQTTSSSESNGAGGGELVNRADLGLEAEHPDGTILQIERISFHRHRTTVELSATNRRDPSGGQIRLNQSWGSKRDTLVLRDDFGEEYPLIAPGGNSELAVKPGETVTGEFAFRGKMNPATADVTLVTNSEGGSPTSSISQTPLIEIKIPMTQRDL